MDLLDIMWRPDLIYEKYPVAIVGKKEKILENKLILLVLHS